MLLGLLAWLPSCLFALAQHRFVGFRGSFLEDAGFHVRMLAALPLTWFMRGDLERRIDGTIAYLTDARLVERDTARGLERLAGAVIGRERPGRAWLIAITLGYVLSGGGLLLRTNLWDDTWLTLPGGVGSLAGIWRTLVAVPLGNAVLVSCAMHVVAWSVALLAARRKLRPVPTHPDGYAGLLVPLRMAGDFAPLLATVSAVMAAALWTLLHRGRIPPSEAANAAVAFVVVAPLLVLSPLLPFASTLAHARRVGTRTYAVAVARVARTFEGKLQLLERDPRVTMDGDAYSLDADMGESFGRIVRTHVVPFPRDAVLLLLAATGAPMVLLLFAALPLEEALRAIGRFRELFL